MKNRSASKHSNDFDLEKGNLKLLNKMNTCIIAFYPPGFILHSLYKLTYLNHGFYGIWGQGIHYWKWKGLLMVLKGNPKIQWLT